MSEVSSERLKSFVERIERLEEEKEGISSDIRGVYKEAEGEGFDKKILRAVVKIRKQDRNERLEEESLLNTYLISLGMEPVGGEE